jgi:hypothetical protein
MNKKTVPRLQFAGHIYFTSQKPELRHWISGAGSQQEKNSGKHFRI